MEQIENWLPVYGYEGLYEISDLGRVKSLAKPYHWMPGQRVRYTKEKFLKPHFGSGGYGRVVLCKDGVQTSKTLHTLVLEAFDRPHAKGDYGRHLDGDPTNNRRSNLCWGTQTQNMQDAKRHGRTTRGERQHGAVLTADAVLQIRADPRNNTQIARAFGVNRATVQHVRARRTWAHI